MKECSTENHYNMVASNWWAIVQQWFGMWNDQRAWQVQSESSVIECSTINHKALCATSVYAVYETRVIKQQKSYVWQ